MELAGTVLIVGLCAILIGWCVYDMYDGYIEHREWMREYDRISGRR